MSWFARAACAGADPNTWFPETGDGDNHGREAKAICATCPVQLDCLVDALERNEDSGIWGGAGEPIRRAFGRVLHTVTHDPTVLPDVCGCEWCACVRSFRDGDVIDCNGPEATHGLRATYNNGCRCGPCRFAVQLYGQEEKFEQRARIA